MRELLLRFDSYLGEKMKNPYFPFILLPTIMTLTFLFPGTMLLFVIVSGVLGYKFLR